MPDFDHASRAKGKWSDPGRVVHRGFAFGMVAAGIGFSP
jgi:hypothetical protein